ncbi:hypothetical protein [Saccharibacillus brassicae]|uniref:Uncharacterized protein n=1 Tax=Saccharibacillus brassicae TaxID=2583377 RepID=A0A4Y6V0A5_SACBS|nr:hypothetical protein [Saccharibacillus brassicae]QDH23449.1 hypothetical protein FFV09_22830 [Saccharibacillus brassicae]
MYKYGPRVYFDSEGAIVFQTGTIETTVTDYYKDNDPRDWHPELIGKEGIEMQQFGWGEYEEEFSSQKLARIDPQTRRPVFEARPEPDPNEVPSPPKNSLEEEVARLRAADLDNKEMINGLGEMLMSLMEG